MINNNFWRINFVLLLIIVLTFSFLIPSACFAQVETILFEDNFDDGNADGWSFENVSNGSREIVFEDLNYFLCLKGHYFACPDFSGWRSYKVEFSLKIFSGTFHLNVRTGGQNRYIFGINQNNIELNKQIGDNYTELASSEEGQMELSSETWYNVCAELEDNTLRILIDNNLILEYEDNDNPLVFGAFNLETLDNSHLYFDDIIITGEQDFIQPASWVRTGGPLGGLGYDIRIHPDDKNIMFVTDNPSGFYKSYDAGKTWVQKNEGINVVSGTTGDAIPVFCATIDPVERNIVWCGFQEANGFYKSEDYGETWIEKINGITEGEGKITVRGFGINPVNNDIVYAGCEIHSDVVGIEFERVSGKIYKTVDGGENWFSCWEGDNLVRFVLIDPRNPDIVYASTGIFDREPANETGVGILKSTDGGETWNTINNGLTNKFVGFLDFHPTNPDILIAAAGMNQQSQYGYTNGGGIFITYNGGESWEKILHLDFVGTAATFAPSNPDVIYACAETKFYRSNDGGETWTAYYKEDEGTWGPPGFHPGFAISIVVDPDDENIVFVNNYIGGNVKTCDGGKTWEDASRGYTGAEIRSVSVNPQNPEIIYSVSRPGIFKSISGGDNWFGISKIPDLGGSEYNQILVNPHCPTEIWITLDELPRLYKSTDSGVSWQEVHRMNEAKYYTMSEFVISMSDPSVMYYGVDKSFVQGFNVSEGEEGYGMYKSINGGDSWTQINNGIDAEVKNVSAVAVNPENPDIVYTGIIEKGIYKTTNGGQNWLFSSSGLPENVDVHDIVIDPQTPEIIYAGLSNNGIYKSVDGGQNWSLSIIGMNPEADITSIVIDPDNPAVLYAADFYTGIFQSTDYGENWYIINDGLEFKAVLSLTITSDGKTIYAGTDGGGVFRLVLEEYSPLLASISPDTVGTVEIWTGNSQTFSINAFDLNGESMTYKWLFDNDEIEGETSESYAITASDSILGIHELKVEVRDSTHIVGVTWNIEIKKTVSEIVESPANIPDNFFLKQNYPNPFNPETTIEFGVKERCNVNLKIYNIAGQLVTELADRIFQAGYHQVKFNASEYASGVYFYSIKMHDFYKVRKMIFIK